jgi:hypothetical protein
MTRELGSLLGWLRLRRVPSEVVGTVYVDLTDATPLLSALCGAQAGAA